MPEQKRELNGRGVWLRDGESSMRMAVVMVIPDAHVLRHSDGGAGSCLPDTLATRLQTAYAEQEYETTGSEETLKTVINTTGDYLIFPAPAWSNEKVNC